MDNILFITNRKNSYKNLVSYLEESYSIDFSHDKNYKTALLFKDYDLVIIDSNDDLKILKEIKNGDIDNYYKYIPVFIIGKDKKKKEFYFDKGAHDYISLPLSNEKFATFIYNAIDQSKYPRALKYSHLYDELTGIFTEDTFVKEAEALLSHHTGKDHYYLIRFDIKKYTLLLYLFGERRAQIILKNIGKLLIELSNKYEMIYGRLNKDRFAVLLNGGKGKLDSFAKELRKAVKDLNKSYYDIELTLGVFEIKNYNVSITEMLSYATVAAKEVKGSLTTLYKIYDDSITERLAVEQQYSLQFSEALKNKEFTIFLQPKFDIINNKMIGAESLVRWIRDGRILSPNIFIPIFEKNGLIAELDREVWNQTAKYIKQRKLKGLPLFPISVNVSRYFLTDENFIDDIINITKKYDISPSLLELELTESLFSNVQLIKAVTTKLRNYGFKILMDDFGSGYSSLNILKDVDFDVLKIDLKFFQAEDKKSQNIIKSVLDIAHSMDIPAIAEGVETRHYIELLRSYGCNYVQGYYYSKPLPLKEFNKFAKKNLPKEGEALKRMINLHRLDVALAKYNYINKNFKEFDKKALQDLLDVYRDELNVSSVFIFIFTPDGTKTKCYFESKEKPEYSIKGMVLDSRDLAQEKFKNIFDEDNLTTKMTHHEDAPIFKSVLFYAVSHKDSIHGTIGFADANIENREWTKEERLALTKLSETLYYIVYKTRTENFEKELLAKQKFLNNTILKLEEKDELQEEIKSLLILTEKKRDIRLMKYNLSTNSGYLYGMNKAKTKLVQINSNNMLSQLEEFFSNDENTSKFSKELFIKQVNDLKLNKIYSMNLQINIDVSTMKKDDKIHYVVIRYKVIMKNNEKIFFASFIDNTDLVLKSIKEKEERKTISDLFVSALSHEFVSMVSYNITKDKIVTYYPDDNTILSKKICMPWLEFMQQELDSIIDTKTKHEIYNLIQIKNLKKIKPGYYQSYTYKSTYKSDKERYLTSYLKLVKENKDLIFVFYTQDSNNRVLYEKELGRNILNLEKKMSIDYLTRMYNRGSVLDKLSAISKYSNKNKKQYLLFMDCDKFKEINDTYGHEEGDKALKHIARILKTIASERNAFTYRYGGDEFVFITDAENEFEIDMLINYINEELRVESQGSYLLSVTIGYTSFDKVIKNIDNIDENSLEKIIRIADDDLRRKKRNKNLVR